MAAPLFHFGDVLPKGAPTVKVVDVGALPVEGHREIYAGLVDRGLAHVVGFEPAADACERLNAEGKGTHTYLPYVVGDGESGEFRICNVPMTSSLYEPNTRLLDMFQNLGELTRVVERQAVETHRLDDLQAVEGADFLKLDVQGGEVRVIEGAARLLESVLIVHTEVCFVPLYQDQPLYAEIDIALRRHGFLLHRLSTVAGRTFKPMMAGNDPNRMIGQMLWGDAIFVRDFTQLDQLSPDRLIKLALILHDVYGSVDLALVCLQIHDRKAGTKLANAYMRRLSGMTMRA